MKLSPQAITTHRIGVTRCPPITSSPNRPIASVETRIRDQIASARRTLATYGPDFSPVSILALGSRLGYLVTFTSLHRGLCELIYSPGPKTARYSVIADRAPCPIRRHPRTATRGLTSFLTSLTSLLTSPGLGIVTKLSNGVLFAHHLILDVPGGSSHLGYRRRVAICNNPPTRVKFHNFFI